MKNLFLFVSLLVIHACSSPYRVSVKDDDGPLPGVVDVTNIPDAVPKFEPRSKYGNPESYEVFGKRYYVNDNSQDFVQ